MRTFIRNIVEPQPKREDPPLYPRHVRRGMAQNARPETEPLGLVPIWPDGDDAAELRLHQRGHAGRRQAAAGTAPRYCGAAGATRATGVQEPLGLVPIWPDDDATRRAR